MTSTPAIARRTDPLSSHHSAQRVTQSGLRESQVQRVADGVHRYPGHTSAELAVLLGMDRYAVARRLPEAEERGLVHRQYHPNTVEAVLRTCAVSGRLAMVWVPGPREPMQMGLILSTTEG